MFQAGSAAKQGLHELETVISNATSLGLKLPVSSIIRHLASENRHQSVN